MTQRTIPNAVRNQFEQEETSEFPLVFLTITHPDLVDPIRIVSDPEEFILDSTTFVGFKFEIKLLTDDDNPPKATLRIQNVDRRIAWVLQRTIDPPIISIRVIARSEFNNQFPRAAIGPAENIYNAQRLYLTDVRADTFYIDGTLRSWDYTQEAWPALRATEARFPGLYW